MKGTAAASGPPNSAELTLGSGNRRAGEVRMAPRLLKDFFACQKPAMKSAQRARLSQPHLPVSGNKADCPLPFLFCANQGLF